MSRYKFDCCLFCVYFPALFITCLIYFGMQTFALICMHYIFSVHLCNVLKMFFFLQFLAWSES